MKRPKPEFEALIRLTSDEVAAVRADLSSRCGGIHSAAREAVLRKLPTVQRVNLKWEFILTPGAKP